LRARGVDHTKLLQTSVPNRSSQKIMHSCLLRTVRWKRVKPVTGKGMHSFCAL
jgi:hypothetical protein